MPRYIEKNEVQLRWNAIRRAATARIDLEVKTYRERRLNVVLAALQDRFTASLDQGELLDLEPEYETWIDDSLSLTALNAPEADGAADVA